MPLQPTVIVICPCCASVTQTSPGEQPRTLQCTYCEQQWTMIVDADRLKDHALT